MEESAKTIGSKGAKICGTQSAVRELKHGHGRDFRHLTVGISLCVNASNIFKYATEYTKT